jgi:hypothetical protein
MDHRYTCVECKGEVEATRAAAGAQNCNACAEAWRARYSRETRRTRFDYMPATDRRAHRERVRP